MVTFVILAISITLQYTSAIMALRLIRITGKYRAWSLIAVAVCLMAIRRSITLFRLISGDLSLPPDILAETVALVISVLMVFGIAMIVPIFRSIKNTAELLRKSEEKFRTLFEDSKDTIYISSKDGSFIDFNPSAVELFGYSREELLALPVEKLYVNPIQRQTIQKNIEKNGFIKEYELQIKRKDGKIIDCIVTASLKKNPDGEIFGYQGIIRNITESKQAEIKLRKLNQAIETAGEAIFMTDMDGIFSSINPAFTKVYGYNAKEVVGKVTPRILKSGVMSPDYYELFWETLLKGKIFDGELINKTKDGRLINIETSANPILDKEKNIIGFLALQRDITDRKQAEKEKASLEIQLRQSQKMEAIGQLTGGIAHDFNNILGSIFGSVDMILMQLPGDHPSRRFADIILDRSKKAAGLVKQMMAYSRQQHLYPEPLIINKAIGDLSMLLDRALEERVELELKMADDLKPINGDKTAIDQIVMNLCVNATDAMKEGGKLTIRTENLENINKYIEDHPDIKPCQYVLLSVTDTGHGIEPEHLEQIFEPFFTTKDVGEGTGLGLSMVYGLVRQHEGYIFCESMVDKGTTFEVLLPVIAKSPQVREQKSISSQLHHGGGTILVVEDQKDLVEILEVMLTELGYDIMTAYDGKKALKLFKDASKQIDLVISDIIMPKMGGKELYQELKKINPEVKFVFTSGYASRGFYKKYDLDPDMKILNKPFRLKEVSDIVKEVMKNESSN